MLTQRKLILPDEPKLSGKSAEDVQALYAHLGDIRRALVSFVDSLNDEGAINIQDGAIDATPIGDQEASTGEFTTLTVTTSSTFPTGTWTPGVSFGGGTTGITYSVQSGSYTRVGDRIIASGRILLSAKGSSTGAAVITGLPVAVGGAAIAYAGLAGRYENITFTGMIQAYGVLSAQTIALEQITEAGAASVLTDANFANNSGIMIGLVYSV